MPEQPTLTKDVLTDPDMVNAALLDRVEYASVFRNAFRNQDVSGVGDDEFSFYVDDGVYDSTQIEYIEEGSEFPERKGDRRKVRVQRHKYGEAYEITMEAQMDSNLAEVQIEANRKINRVATTMDAVAFNVVRAGIAGNDYDAIAPTGDAGALSYNDIVDADTTVRSSNDGEYAPTQLYVGHQALGAVRKMDEFTHATAEGDEVIRNGRIGSIAGLADVYTSSTPFIDMGAEDAYLVDPEWFGREAEWVTPTVDRDSDTSRQVPVIMQLYGLIGFTETHPNAAIRIGN